MNRNLLRHITIAFILFLSACAPAAKSPVQLPVTELQTVAIEAVQPCEDFKTATWENTTLYKLTYDCIPVGWEDFFGNVDVRAQVQQISDSIEAQVKERYKIGPAIVNTFRALYLVQPGDVKAIIMGQDPAPQPGLATGLAFSTEPGVSTSMVASIQRVVLEAQNEGNCIDLDNGDLVSWAENGVLLLNMALTIPCPPDESSCTIGGHLDLWQEFTLDLVAYLNSAIPPSAFILWGSKAGDYAQFVTNPDHIVLKGGHPSPRVSGEYFFCKNYFNCANKWLEEKGRAPIDWNLASGCEKQEPCIWEWHWSTRSSTYQSPCQLVECQ